MNHVFIPSTLTGALRHRILLTDEETKAQEKSTFLAGLPLRGLLQPGGSTPVLPHCGRAAAPTAGASHGPFAQSQHRGQSGGSQPPAPISCPRPAFSVQTGVSRTDAMRPKLGRDHPLLVGETVSLTGEALRLRECHCVTFQENHPRKSRRVEEYTVPPGLSWLCETGNYSHA